MAEGRSEVGDVPHAPRQQVAARRDFHACEIAIGRQALVLDRDGVLHWPSERMLIVADLHLEKGSSRAARCRLLPPYDTATTLTRLQRTIERLRPRHVVALGDSFHDRGGAGRLAAHDRVSLGQLMQGRTWTWITGNHDPDPPAGIGGEVAAELDCGGIALRHVPQPKAGAEIAGHLHPAAKVARRGHVQRRPGFLHDAVRVLLPAFGAYTGGLNVLDEAYRELVRHDWQVAVVGRSGVYPVARHQLRPD